MSTRTEITRIRDQLRRAMLGAAWHGPSVIEAVAHFDERSAHVRPPHAAHSAWQIVLHIASWLEIVRRRLEGRSAPIDVAVDWPEPPGRTRSDWEATLARLRAAHQALDHAIDALDDAQLDRIVDGRDYTLYVMLHGVVQHALYHAGQLMALRQAATIAAGPRLYGDLVSLWPLVSPPENYPEEVATFRARFRRHGVGDGARVLHLGSGGGSIDFNLKQFYRVTGIDVSEGMVAHARRINPDVEYHVGDIRTHRLARTFDAVLVHDAIAYMTSVDELEAVYRTAAAHLAPGGVMVALPEELPARVAKPHSEAETIVAAGRAVTIVQAVYDADPQDHRFENTFVFLVHEGDDLRVEVDRHANGVFAIDEFVAAIEAAGFEATVDDWELSDWEPGVEPLPLITAVLRG